MARPKKAEKEKKIQESVYFDPDVHKWLKEHAENNVSTFTNSIAREYMNEKKANA